jgi:hypothetical protein
MDFSDLFRSPRWRRFRIEVTAPHSLYYDGKIAVLVLRRSRPEGDWALSATALDYVVKALRDQRIAHGFIALVERWDVVAHDMVSAVAARLDGIEPNPGPFGEYFWLSNELKSVANFRTTSDEIPF